MKKSYTASQDLAVYDIDRVKRTVASGDTIYLYDIIGDDISELTVNDEWRTIADEQDVLAAGSNVDIAKVIDVRTKEIDPDDRSRRFKWKALKNRMVKINVAITGTSAASDLNVKVLDESDSVLETITFTVPIITDDNSDFYVQTTKLPAGAKIKVDGTLVKAGGDYTATILATLYEEYEVPHHVEFTVGAESTNDINVEMQIKDAADADVAQNTILIATVCSDQEGVTVSTVDGGAAIGTDGKILDTLRTNGTFRCITKEDGKIDITFTQTGDASRYIMVELPGVGRFVSPLLAFTA